MLKVKNKSNFDLIDNDFLVDPFNDGFSEDTLKSTLIQGKDSYKIIINIKGISPDDIDIKIANNNLTVTVVKADIMESKRSKTFYVGNVKLKDIKQEINDEELIFEVPIK